MCELGYIDGQISTEGGDGPTIARLGYPEIKGKAPEYIDYSYYIDLQWGYNFPMSIIPGDPSCHVVECDSASCDDAVRGKSDFDTKIYKCRTNKQFTITFCP